MNKIFSKATLLPNSKINIINNFLNSVSTQPNEVGLTVLKATEEVKLSYAELHKKIISLASELQKKHAQGERIVILLNNDEQYVISFFACLFAGLIAVPAHPPESLKPQHLERISSIILDSGASCVITTSDLSNKFEEKLGDIVNVSSIFVDALLDCQDYQYKPVSIQNDDIAFLQYTSGSTALPKGVKVSFSNLDANLKLIQSGFSISQSDKLLSWLPLYHDMGLIGGLLLPLFAGVPLILTSHNYFLERPIRWLEAISKYKITGTGGPDFSYRLCLERIKESQIKDLDLSSWNIAFSGAEPVRYNTLTEFYQKFKSVGFKKEAFYPCYGLAESTLFVTGAKRGKGMITKSIDQAALSQNIAKENKDGAILVSSGGVYQAHEIMIMSAESLTPCNDNEVGEIWVSGKSISSGYWNNQDATNATFVQYKDKSWLRTGDLGFQEQGELFVTGRLKDLIIIRGRNIYPQDVELHIENNCEFTRKGRVAIFAIKTKETETIGVALELPKRFQNKELDSEIFNQINQSVINYCGESIGDVMLLQPGCLPKTSSGKLQRSACSLGYINHTLDEYARFSNQSNSTSASYLAPKTQLAQQVSQIWQDVLSVERVGLNDNFFALGGDSIKAVTMASKVNTDLNYVCEPRLLFESQNLASFVQALELTSAQPTDKQIKIIERSDNMPLSPGQRLMWFTDKLAKSEAERLAYNISGGVEFNGSIDHKKLSEAFKLVLNRHEIFRIAFVEKSEEPSMVLLDEILFELKFADISHHNDSELDNIAIEIQKAFESEGFDLAKPPLLKAKLLHLNANKTQLFVNMHHIISDGWSMSNFMRELGLAYKQVLGGSKAELAPLKVQFLDYAYWQNEYKSSQSYQLEQSYWQKICADTPLNSAIKPHLPKTSEVSYLGKSVQAKFSLTNSEMLLAFAKQQKTSLFNVLLSSYQLFIHGLTKLDDIVLGTDLAGREQPELASLIGYFIKVLPRRSKLEGDLTICEYIQQTQQQSIDINENQNVPLDEIIQLSKVPFKAGVSPLIQQLFVMHNMPEINWQFNDIAASQLVSQANELSKFDSVFFVTPGSEIECRWLFKADLYQEQKMQNLLAKWIEFTVKIISESQSPVASIVKQLQVDIDSEQKSKKSKFSSLKRGLKSKVKAVESPLKKSFFNDKGTFPIVLEAPSKDVDPVSWAQANRPAINDLLLSHGGIVFRGLSLESATDFEKFAEALHPGLYGNYGDLPKNTKGKNTYKSTPYPKDKMILFHNESAHLSKWPRKQWFYCETPSPIGGATPIVDCRKMLDVLSTDLVNKISEKGLLYVRSFIKGLDVPWQSFFQTENKAEVEQMLRNSGTEFEWLEKDGLQTRTKTHGVIVHPLSGERTFFNQVQLHHVSVLDEGDRNDLLELVGENNLPRNVYFGDGSKISTEEMKIIGDAYEECAVRFDWRKSDVVMLDNMLAAHARDPFEGARKIVVAMGDMFNKSQLSISETEEKETEGYEAC
ncbi:MAG: AMP-binding protein [Colwellia sp.]|nr:AMP-binding protein [Colwellia sp.]